MPIRADLMPLYPGGSILSPQWLAIRVGILIRADWRCEGSPAYPDCRAKDRQEHPVTSARVILTVAHIDHDPSNNDPENLRAWCQLCHNTHDAPHRAKNAARTRRTFGGRIADLFPESLP